MSDSNSPTAPAPPTSAPTPPALRRLLSSRIVGVVVMVVVLYLLLLALSPDARNEGSRETLTTRLGMYGVPTIGVGILIIAGGIDLSIGSVVGLVAVLFAILLREGVPPVPAVLLLLGFGACIGLAHGLLVAYLRLQPFIVTLCGWFVYRGLARWVAGDNPVNLTKERIGEAFAEQAQALRELLYSGQVKIPGAPFSLPHPLILLFLLAIVLGLFLHRTRHGRYLFAIGANEDAARYAGIRTGGYKILAYVLCSMLAALGGILFVLDNQGAKPDSAGNLLELYAITGAVLGGCSLRGGEGSIPGMVLGAAVLPILKQFCSYVLHNDKLEYVVVGGALLLGTIADELLRRLAARRRVTPGG